jgi:hypothetical protein
MSIKPGNLVFKSGAGGTPKGASIPDAAGDIIFMHADKEWMRIKENGSVIVRDVVLFNDADAYKRFKAWLLEATVRFDGETECKAVDAVISAQAGRNLS